jgi:hypothetical protein
MIWWTVAFDAPYADRPNGYIAWTDDRAQQLGVFFTDGARVPDVPSYGYAAVDTAASPPSWASSVTEPSPPVPASIANEIPAAEFILLFTPAEVQSIRASSDPLIQQWFLAISTGSEPVDLNGPRVQGGVNYLAGTGYIQPARVPQILAGQAPS